MVQTCFGDSPERVNDFYKCLSLRMVMHGHPTPSEKVHDKERAGYLSAMKALKDEFRSIALWGCHKYFFKRNNYSMKEDLRSPSIGGV